MNEPVRKRGRPATFDQAAALDVAATLFQRHGFDGTSIAMLTEGTGVTAPTLYAAFGSKEELYSRALAHYQQRGRDARISLPYPRSSVYRTVETFLRQAAIRFADPKGPKGCMVATGSLACGTESQSAAETTACARRTSLEAFVVQLEQAKRDGELPVDTDSEALARFYSAVVQGMSVQAIDGADTTNLNALVDIALAAWPKKSPRAERRAPAGRKG